MDHAGPGGHEGARLDLAAAAGLGRLDFVKTLDGATDEQLKTAFLYACGYGRDSVVEFLLENGADLSARSGDGQTGLHWAVIGGHPNTVKLLLRHAPPLEAENVYDGTVLGQALWSAAHGGDPDVYIAILDALVAAGARIPERHVPVNKRVDEWLERRGSHVEPSWGWYGEKPGPAERQALTYT